MKVLFLQDVPPTARAGDVKEVKNGFGRNFLLPRRLATFATQHALAQAAELRKEAEIRKQQESATWQEIGQRLAETKITLTARVGPTGRLYGSITQTMIAHAVSEEISREVSRRDVSLPSPIRAVGDHPVRIQLFEDVFTTITLVVESDLPQEADGGTEPEKELQESGESEPASEDDETSSSDENGQTEQPKEE